MIEPTPEMLRIHVLNELDRIIFEMGGLLNTGLIARSIAQQLKIVVEAWPNVTIHLPLNRHSQAQVPAQHHPLGHDDHSPHHQPLDGTQP